APTRIYTLSLHDALPIYEAWKDRLGWIGVILIAIAALGTLTSLGITKVPPSGASKKFILNPFKEFWKGAKMLYTDQPLWLTVMRSEEHTSELQSRFDLVC